jgi:hypothetical protein
MNPLGPEYNWLPVGNGYRTCCYRKFNTEARGRSVVSSIFSTNVLDCFPEFLQLVSHHVERRMTHSYVLTVSWNEPLYGT